MLDKGNSFAASTNYHVLFTILLYEIRTPPIPWFDFPPWLLISVRKNICFY